MSSLGLGARPGGFTCFGLGLEHRLEFIAALGQILQQLIRLDLGLGLGLAGLDLEGGEGGIHLVDPLLGPVQVEMHAALL
ncbi:hypothetical protein ACVOMS_06445 [Bradyrhizobium guangxiense]